MTDTQPDPDAPITEIDGLPIEDPPLYSAGDVVYDTQNEWMVTIQAGPDARGLYIVLDPDGTFNEFDPDDAGTERRMTGPVTCEIHTFGPGEIGADEPTFCGHVTVNVDGTATFTPHPEFVAS